MTSYFEDFIPASRVPELEKKIKSLNKRAVKMNLPEMILVVDKDNEELRDIIIEDYDNCRKFKIRYVYVSITGESPKYPDWNLKGVIDHERDADFNLVSAVPGFELDPAYRTIDPTCDHCNTQRFRKKTFVVINENSEREMRVGSGCIKDFLGHKNAEQILNHAKSLAFLDFNGFREPGFGPGWVPEEWPIEEVMAFAAKSIRLDGWTSKAKAMDYGSESTAGRVSDDFDALYSWGSKRRDHVVHPNETDKQVALDALEWIKSFDLADPKTNDYVYNCGLLAKSSLVRNWEFGLTCSIVASYQNHLAKQNEQKFEKKISNYIGAVGDKGVELAVTFLKEWGFDGQWGTVYIMKFVTDEGNVVIWKTAAPVMIDQGQKITLRGSIKAHEEKYEIKQTIMTRCRVLEDK
jgi:hypothetical protein